MKTILLTIAFAILTTAVSAQNLSFGIKAGPNFSILNYDPHDNVFQTGFNAGAVLDIKLHNWSIQPGVFYTTKGEQINNINVYINGNPAGPFTQHIRLNYLQVPVNFLYHAKVSPLISFYIGGGPYFAYGISGKATMGQESSSINFDSKQEPGSLLLITFKNPDIGAGALAGLLIAEKFSVDLGYDYGLTHINNNGPIVNRVIHLSVGYFFR